MGKRITIIGINFYPEDTSTGLYTTQMAEYLQEHGFEVSVVTGFPYYPQWKIWENYKNKDEYLEEKYKNIKVYRYKQFTPKNPTLKNRIRHILSFTFGSLKNLNKVKKTDLIIAIVPFTTDVWLAHKLAKRTGAKIWVHVQDFEFDAAFEAEIIPNKKLKFLIGKFLFWYEKRLLNKADILSTISYSMIDKAKKKAITNIFYFPNWIDENFINPENAKVHPYLSSNKFKILYSGNIGAKQDWETYLKVIKYFKNREDIQFIIVGDGARKSWLIERIKNFRNVKYFKPVPYEELPHLLCSADLHVLFQKEDVVNTVMPSKLLGMMASAKPSLVTGNPKSEVAKILKKSQGGKYFSATEINEIRNFIESLKSNKDKVRFYGQNARNYVIKNFSKEKVLKRFKDKIEEILGG